MGVAGSVSGDHADGLAAGDPVQQIGQYGRITNATAGDLDGPDFPADHTPSPSAVTPLAGSLEPVALTGSMSISRRRATRCRATPPG